MLAGIDSGKNKPYHLLMTIAAIPGVFSVPLCAFIGVANLRAMLILLAQKMLSLCSVLDSTEAPWRNS